MKIKICGLFRDQDIDYVNEARPDYAGFVFAKSSRRVAAPLAQYLRFRLADGITPVGVFVNAPIDDVAALFHNGTISVAQLHGGEDENYIVQLKKKCITSDNHVQLKVIKVLKYDDLKQGPPPTTVADYFLLDSGAGSGKTFNWKKLNSVKFDKPWFLAGGINIDNIKQAMSYNPFAVDISGGAETDGVKDREKILQLIAAARKGNMQ
jgi:phosphoribosylanthranilate isomerase